MGKRLNLLENTPKEGRRTTELGKSYWNSNGAYEVEYKELVMALVPTSGSAETVHGELLRNIGNLFYEFCNNGNCNAIEYDKEEELIEVTCDECCGSGYVEEDFGGDEFEEVECPECFGDGEVEDYEESTGIAIVSTRYLDQIEFIQETFDSNNVPRKNIDNLLKFYYDDSFGDTGYSFSDAQMDRYNKVVDDIMALVLRTENTVL